MDSLAETLFALGKSNVVELMRECWFESHCFLGPDHKESERRWEFLRKSDMVIQDCADSPASVRRSASLMDNYMALRGRQITYQTLLFTKPSTAQVDGFLSGESPENEQGLDQEPLPNNQQLTPLDLTEQSLSAAHSWRELAPIREEPGDEVLQWSFSDLL